MYSNNYKFSTDHHHHNLKHLLWSSEAWRNNNRNIHQISYGCVWLWNKGICKKTESDKHADPAYHNWEEYPPSLVLILTKIECVFIIQSRLFPFTVYFLRWMIFFTNLETVTWSHNLEIICLSTILFLLGFLTGRSSLVFTA